MVTMHLSEDNVIREPLGIACRGGPVNGPFAAGFLLTAKLILQGYKIPIARLYSISGSTPAAAMAAIGRENRACSMWARLRPADIIDASKRWWSKAVTIGRIIRSESIYESRGLERLIRENIPADELFSPEAIPLSIMTVDYLTGEPIIFNTDDPAFYPVIHEGILATMALTPFLRLQVIWAGPMGLSPFKQTEDDIRLHLMDGGYRDNLMVEKACRDGINTLIVVDINGLEVSLPESSSCKHWSASLQRAFHTLITTNDRRDLYGATRVNEELKIRDQLKELLAEAPAGIREKLEAIVSRMDTERLELGAKHPLQVYLGSEPNSFIPFNFTDFEPWETEHLIDAGHRAAANLFDRLKPA